MGKEIKKTVNDERIMFDEVVHIIEERKRNAYVKVNEELISMYWDVGKYVNDKVNNNLWGSKTVERLSNYIRDRYPTLTGFDRSGIYRMKQFYETYHDDEIVAPLVRQISWSNNLLIMGSTKTKEEREFYIRMCIKNHYKKRELERQISSAYYERYILSNGKANESLESVVGEDYPNTKLLDTYSLEFLDLPKEFRERDLKEALIHNMKDFILEIGKDFTFVGEEYPLRVDNEDFYIDLLMYNRSLKCLVAFELKIGKFIPEYISKMDFYLEVLDEKIKKKDENPSVGIILCSSKSDSIVKYSMKRSMSPTMVSNYTLHLPDKKLLENKLSEIKELLEK